MALRVSRMLAIVIGLALPVGESIRRWGTGAPWQAWADDFVLGAVLLAAAWSFRRGPESGRRCLIGARGFVCGAGMMSLLGNMRDLGEPENANIPRAVVLAVIGAGWIVAVGALVATITAPPKADA